MVVYDAKKHKVPHIWNYFETGHVKGEHDAIGTCIQTMFCRKEMKFIIVSINQDSKSIFEWCYSIMGEGISRQEDK